MKLIIFSDLFMRINFLEFGLFFNLCPIVGLVVVFVVFADVAWVLLLCIFFIIISISISIAISIAICVSISIFTVISTHQQ
jgi:hypothetical protein